MTVAKKRILGIAGSGGTSSSMIESNNLIGTCGSHNEEENVASE
jgi:hypothetical protein